jgi:acetyl esterase/lipase
MSDKLPDLACLHPRRRFLVWPGLRLLAALALCSGAVSAQTVPNVEYANVGGQSLRLDLYLPASGGPHPLVVWIHGGGWCAGARAPLES